MNKLIIYAGLILALFSACVPLKQFQDVKSQGEEDAIAAKQLKNENEDLIVDNNELKAEAERLKKDVELLTQDTMRLAKSNWTLKKRNKELANEYAELLKRFGGNTTTQSSELLAHVQNLHEQLQKREDELLRAERELASKQQDLIFATEQLANAEKELEARNKRLVELEAILNEKDSAMNALRNSIASALTDFGDDELSVYTKDGKVYVSMEEKLLFQSGSYSVSSAGKSAIQKIGKVLENKTDIYIMVEGHTDNVPYKSTVLLDNWDLSVKRATSVSRIIINNSSVSPNRITAAGRGEFVPIDTDNTPEARRRNRRTEIILAPNFDKIFNILNN
ncbi:OmpA/MotB family protein [Saccharicrinis aurantiacus]|uniref:OmpA/MotB family protein n=1 Tax=Saccharicrinis aurantiacus TaxID=1849719 RepID=UPI00083823F1|nr:OmpA family protein [Saccharicrinis aurantiacus]